MPRSWFYLLIILALSALLTALIFWTGPQSRATLQPRPPQHVLTSEVRAIDFQPMTRSIGQLQPKRRSHLQFEVSGQLIARHVEPGHKVTAGDVLLEVESGDYEDTVAEARAALQQERDALARDRQLLALMEEQVELQRNEAERIQKLGRDSLASKSNYDSVRQTLLQLEAETARLRHNIDTASARLSQLEAAHSRAKRNLARTQLQAPFAATVDEVSVEVGDYVTSGQRAAKLVQLDELDLALDVPAPHIDSLSLDQRISLVVDDEEREGRIVALAADPDPRTHTYDVRIRLPAGDWYPGQLAEARLPGRPYTDAHVVPATAILHSEGNTYVFKVSDSELQRIKVKVLQRYKDWQVVEGVATGTTVVARDVAALAEGQQVTQQNTGQAQEDR